MSAKSLTKYNALRKELENISRSMITTSHYNLLDEQTFINYIDSFILTFIDHIKLESHKYKSVTEYLEGEVNDKYRIS